MSYTCREVKASAMMYGYSTSVLSSAKAKSVAERVAIFRPHVGAKSVPQEFGADSNDAWRHRHIIVGAV